MKENLKVSHYQNGDPIVTNLSNHQWANATSGAFAIYDNDDANNTTYGKLYNWYAVVDKRNLCPVGWHLPSEKEWTVLESFLGGRDVAGGKLKTPIGWMLPNTGASNKSGFSGLPGGYRHGSGMFNAIRSNGYWWSSTETSTAGAFYWELCSFYGNSARNGNFENQGCSVRCLKD